MVDRPTYNIARIEQQRDRLHSAILGEFRDQTLLADVFQRFVAFVQGQLPRSVGFDAVFQSCSCLLGRQLTQRESLLFAWRLAGNMALLREDKPVHPWVVQLADEWVPLQIVKAVASRNKRDQRGTEYTCRILAGTPAGMRTITFWKPGVVRIISHELGFTPGRRGKYPLHNARELVGLRCYGLIEQARSTTSPVFYEVACTASLFEWNREHVLRMRSRIVPCPRNFLHACYRCAVGYNECPAGVHRATYETAFCSKCGNAEALFDPEEHSPHCIDCNYKERMHRNVPS
jgi:hypothetical protein